jgi:hypothetical protein
MLTLSSQTLGQSQGRGQGLNAAGRFYSQGGSHASDSTLRSAVACGSDSGGRVYGQLVSCFFFPVVRPAFFHRAVDAGCAGREPFINGSLAGCDSRQSHLSRRFRSLRTTATSARGTEIGIS